MRGIRCLVFCSLGIFFEGCLSVIPQYDRSLGMPDWERSHLNALVERYDGPGSTIGASLSVTDFPYFNGLLCEDLVKRFVVCARSGDARILAGINRKQVHSLLLEHARNLVGREIMYRIIAKLEPRINSVSSLEQIIDGLDSGIYGGVSDNLVVCINLLRRLDVGLCFDSPRSLEEDLSELAKGGRNLVQNFQRVFDFPRSFSASRDVPVFRESAFFVSENDKAREMVSRISAILRTYTKELEEGVNNLRFELVFDPNAQDRYDVGDNTITLTGKSCFYNIVTGPVLSNEFEPTYVETQWRELPAVSVLKHELGHYLRVGLEKMVDDVSFLRVGPALFGQRMLSSDYIVHLQDIWDDSEELTEIFGILCISGMLYYDGLNQSAFNLSMMSNVDGVRYSHRDSRFLVVPYGFFGSVFRRDGRLPISNDNVVHYDKVVANI